MLDYDPNAPLISIHVPKTGGVSVRNLYQEWFGNGYLTHYKKSNGDLPDKHDLAAQQKANKAVLVHGHFNKHRGFGVEAYYPDVKQFITILRDPFERAVSRYFYLNSIEQQNKHTLIQELLAQKPQWSTFSHFPKKVTMSNYEEVIEENFIEIGVLECIDESLTRIAKKLNKDYQANALKTLNVSKRTIDIPSDVKDKFIENNPLEYAVYHYALERYK